MAQHPKRSSLPPRVKHSRTEKNSGYGRQMVQSIAWKYTFPGLHFTDGAHRTRRICLSFASSTEGDGQPAAAAAASNERATTNIAATCGHVLVPAKHGSKTEASGAAPDRRRLKRKPFMVGRGLHAACAMEPLLNCSTFQAPKTKPSF